MKSFKLLAALLAVSQLSVVVASEQTAPKTEERSWFGKKYDSVTGFNPIAWMTSGTKTQAVYEMETKDGKEVAKQDKDGNKIAVKVQTTEKDDKGNLLTDENGNVKMVDKTEIVPTWFASKTEGINKWANENPKTAKVAGWAAITGAAAGLTYGAYRLYNKYFGKNNSEVIENAEVTMTEVIDNNDANLTEATVVEPKTVEVKSAPVIEVPTIKVSVIHDKTAQGSFSGTDAQGNKCGR